MSDLPTKDEADAPEAAPDKPEAAAAMPETAPENAPEDAPETAPESAPEAPAAPAVTRAAAPAPRRGLAGVVAALALLVALGALGANFMLWQRLGAMKGQLARQSRETATRAEAAGNDSRQARDVAQSAAARMDAVEGRVADMAQWRAQLQELLRNAAHARDENLAVELEAALLAAQEQAQMTGNVQPMLAALRTAERRLARNVDPVLLPAARAVEQDLETLRTAPAVDVAALLSRIERLHAQVDSWPASADVELADKAQAAASDPLPAMPPLPEGAPWWERAMHAAGREARALVRVSTLGQPQAGTLTVEQVFLLRERLRLHLQGARLALLGHRYDAARSDLGAAAGLLEHWFSLSSPQVQAALNELRSLERQSQGVQQPGARATLRALGEVAGTASTVDVPLVTPPDEQPPAEADGAAAPEHEANAPAPAPEKQAPASSEEAAAPQPEAPETAKETKEPAPEPAADAASAAGGAEPAAEPASAPAVPETPAAPASGDEAAAPQQEASL